MKRLVSVLPTLVCLDQEIGSGEVEGSLGGAEWTARRLKRLNGTVEKAEGESYFGSCDRDDEGYCKPKDGGGESPIDSGDRGLVKIDKSTLTWDGIKDSAKDHYGKAGATVDGRKVIRKVDNESSIGSSLENYESLPGIREIRMDEFENVRTGTATGRRASADDDDRVAALAEKIKVSNSISALIVVDDGHPDGPYILEGGHRFDALVRLGARSFPAKVVLDLDGIRDHAKTGEMTRRLASKSGGRMKSLRTKAPLNSYRVRLVPPPQLAANLPVEEYSVRATSEEEAQKKAEQQSAHLLRAGYKVESLRRYKSLRNAPRGGNGPYPARKGDRGSSDALGAFPGVRRKEEGTCGVGERADLTGCTPASGPENKLGSPPSGTAGRVRRIQEEAAAIPFTSKVGDCGAGKWCKDKGGDDRFTVKLSSGQEYTVRAMSAGQTFPLKLGNYTIPEIDFTDEEGRFDVTGGGHAFEVFGKVVPSVVSWFQNRKPAAATFSAEEKSRQKLYDRLAATVTASMPDYFAASFDKKGTRYYVIGKRDRKDEILSRLEDRYDTDEPPNVIVRGLGESKLPILIPATVDPLWWTVKGWEIVSGDVVKKGMAEDVAHAASLVTGFTDLADLRRKLSWDRARQDAAIVQAWRERRIALSGYEGRSKLTPEQQAAQLRHGGESLGYAQPRKGMKRKSGGASLSLNERVNVLDDLLGPLNLSKVEAGKRALEELHRAGYDPEMFGAAFQIWSSRQRMRWLDRRRGLSGAIEKAEGGPGCHWVTIGAHNHEGGSPVCITGEGQVKLGPSHLTGHPVNKLPSSPKKKPGERPEGPKDHLTQPKEKPDGGKAKPGKPKRPGGGADAGKPAQPGKPVAEATPGPGDAGAGQVGASPDQPVGAKAPRRVPASKEEVTKRLDRHEAFFRKKANAEPNEKMREKMHEVANWMGMLKQHLHEVGSDEMLKELGEEKAGKGVPVQYEGGWDSMGGFAEAYLNRAGITLTYQQGDKATKDKPLVSSVTSANEEAISRLRKQGRQDFIARDPAWGVDKLKEAQHLPGLEKSEDLGKLLGGEQGAKVERFTPELFDKLDERYGKDGWIVKPYSDEAFSSFGIFFPQYARQLQPNAAAAVWDAGEKVGRHGFTLLRQSQGGGFGKALGQFGKLTLKEPKGDAERWEHPPEIQKKYNAKVLQEAEKVGALMKEGDLSGVTGNRNVGGQEHDVYEDGKTGRFWKLTKGGHFGQSKDLPEYLECAAATNRLWPELQVQFHGITKDPQTGAPRAVTSANKVEGDNPSQEEVHHWFEENGWEPHGDRAESPSGEDLGQWTWRDPKTGTVVDDANAGNFRRTAQGRLVPIDIDVRPGKKLQAQLKDDGPERVVGVKHQGGDEYRYGTGRYDRTLYGDVRDAADNLMRPQQDKKGNVLPSLAENEHGAAIPTGMFMAQPAFPVVGITNEERAQGILFKRGQEGRTHVITRNGKAELVPHTTWLKEEHLPVVFENDDTRAMAQAAVDAINALPEAERQGQVYAPDIVKTKDGYRVVEANPSARGGGSGYLGDSPFVISAVAAHVTGTEPAHVKFIRQLLTKHKKEKALRGIVEKALKSPKIKGANWIVVLEDSQHGGNGEVTKAEDRGQVREVEGDRRRKGTVRRL